MRVLLTGATGFLGRRVLRALLAQDLTVRCAVRPSSDVDGLKHFIGSADWSRVELVSANLCEVDECRELLDSCDVLYHVAAGLTGCTSSLVLSSVVPTRTLFNAAGDTGCKRVVLIGSLGVYGPQSLRRNAVLDEDCPVDAAPQHRDAYTYSKVLQEDVARQVADDRGLSLTILRPGVIYGDERGVLTHRIGLQFGKWLLRMGGRQQIPLTYVDNCAAAVVQAGLVDSAAGQIINIVDDELPTGREIVRRYRRSGRKLRVIGIPQFAIGWLARFNEWYGDQTEEHIPKVLTRHRVDAMWKPLRYSNERAKTLLNWKPAVDLDTAFERTLIRENSEQRTGARMEQTSSVPRSQLPVPSLPAQRETVNTLFLSSVYPNPAAPVRGTFNRAMCRALTEFGDVRVVAPLPWTECVPLIPRVSKRASAAALRDFDQSQREIETATGRVCPPVERPMYFYPPKILRRAYGRFMWASVRSSVQRVCRDFQPDLVLSYWAHPDGEAGMRAARAVGAKSGVIIGGSDVLLLTSKPKRREAICRVLRESDLVITVCDGLRQRVIELGADPESVHTVYQGVDRNLFCRGDQMEARRALGISTDEAALLWVGRMEPVKRLDVLLGAFLQLRIERPQAHLYMVGTGAMQDDVHDRISRLGLEHAVSLMGAVNQKKLPTWYQAADATVLSSDSEGLPNVLRESLACGTPFVSTDVGSVAEIVSIEHSLLVPPGDCVGLSRAMLQILDAEYRLGASLYEPRNWSDAAADIAALVDATLTPNGISAAERRQHSVPGVSLGIEALSGTKSPGGAEEDRCRRSAAAAEC